MGEKLDGIYRDYMKIQFEDQEDEIGPLVKLDTDIRRLLKETRKQGRQWTYWKDYYSGLSLRIGHFSDSFEYGGALLEKAHKINPNSQYRNYTLFSEINSDKYCWVEKSKNINAAFQYLKEFPDGPFVADTYLLLGGFYASLYDFIRSESKTLTSESHEEVMDPFISYIKKPSSVPIEKQEREAKTNAVKFLEAYLRAEKDPVEWARIRVAKIKAGTDYHYGRFSCPD